MRIYGRHLKRINFFKFLSLSRKSFKSSNYILTMSEDWKGRTQVKKISVNFFRNVRTNIFWKFKTKYIKAGQTQFGANFGIVGDVHFNDEKEEIRKQYVAIDTKRWDLDGKDNNFESRLLFRAFQGLVENEKTGKKTGGSYQGGLELSVLNSLNLSLGARRALSSFYMVLPGFRYLTQVYQKRTYVVANYVLPLYPVGDEPVRFFKIKRRMRFGHNYKVTEVGRKEPVANIYHKRWNIGGRYDIYIDDEDLQYHKNFAQLLILFVGIIRYRKEVEALIKKLIKEKSKVDDDIGYRFEANKEELALFRNPRIRR